MTPRLRGLTVSVLAVALCAAAALPARAGDRHDRFERREHGRDDYARERRGHDRRDDRWSENRHDERRYEMRRDDHRSVPPLPPLPLLPRLHGSRLPRPNFEVFFGWGSGYRYGSPYSGRVYGSVAPLAGYGRHAYYGDVRLEVRPRDAAVWVDGYYAGTVDDFDGTFQRLTLEVGPHRIEIEAPGCEGRIYDVYVDPSRTVDIHDQILPR